LTSAVLLFTALAVSAFGVIGVWEGSPASLVSWVLLYGVLIALHREDRRRRDLALLAYTLATLAGLLIIRDNLANFHTPFSGGHDDSEYFLNIVAWVSGRGYFLESILFQGLNAAYGFLISLVTFRSTLELSLLDLLPLNFFAVGLCVVYIDKIIDIVTGSKAPVWLVLLPVLANNNFIGNATRFYRDVYVGLLIVLTIYLALRHKYVRALLVTFLLGLFRGGNGLLMLFFVFITFVMDSTDEPMKVRKIYGWALVAIVVAFGFGLNDRGNVIVAAASDITSFERRVSAFQGMTYSELVTRRMLKKAERGGNTVRIAAMEEGGVQAFAYKSVYSLLFPIELHGPRMAAEFNSLYGDVDHTDDGFFLYNVAQWFMTLTWILLLPYLLIGVWIGYRKNNLTVNIVSFYLLSFMLISQLSFQIRHTLGFVVLHPIIMAIGYRDETISPQRRRLIAAGVAFVILGYNIFERL
jgi:hypothetical protein